MKNEEAYFTLRKYFLWIVYSILSDPKITYEQVSSAVNRKYCANVNIHEYYKILSLNIALQELSKNNISTVDDCRLELKPNEREILSKIISLFNDHGRVALIPIHIIDEHKKQQIGSDYYLSFFENWSDYAI